MFLIATAVAGRCRRCHGDATPSDLPLGSVVGRQVNIKVAPYALHLVDVEGGVAVRHELGVLVLRGEPSDANVLKPAIR